MTESYLDRRFNSAKSAQTNLLTKENGGSFANLEPDRSKIRLDRDRRKLKTLKG